MAYLSMPSSLTAIGDALRVRLDGGISRMMHPIWSTRVGSKNAAFHDGALASLLLSPRKLVFSLTLGLVVLLLCVWIIDWLFVFKFWSQGIERLRKLLDHDLARGISLCAQQGGSASAITA